MKIRKYTEADLPIIEKIDPFCIIGIKYNRDIRKENILCVLDDNNEVISVGYLEFDTEQKTLGRIMIKTNSFTVSEYKNNLDVESILTDAYISRLKELKTEYTETELFLRLICEADDVINMQLYLEKGFSLHSVIPVLKYDLADEIQHYKIPVGIEIKPLQFTIPDIDKYYEADLSSSGKPQSRSELWFMSGEPSFKCFTAVHNSEIVGAASIWKINEERSATENIFVVPEFRRKNIARELIATALEELKSRDMKMATLSMKGTNLAAMKLYLSIGYKLYYILLDLRYEL